MTNDTEPTRPHTLIGNLWHTCVNARATASEHYKMMKLVHSNTFKLIFTLEIAFQLFSIPLLRASEAAANNSSQTDRWRHSTVHATYKVICHCIVYQLVS